jgi:5'-deoxynucleotidase YfbR-like HD superfamily hydrolase
MKKDLNKQLDGIYNMMSHTYHGNWSYRWKGTPWMSKILKNKKKESILAHEMCCIGLWFGLRRICPNLDALVDSTRMYEIFWGHDLGEIFIGDIPQFSQLRGRGIDKSKLEKEEILRMSKKAPKEVTTPLLSNFDSYEAKNVESKDLEVLICRLIDNMQGNHFGMVFGNSFDTHSDVIDKVVNRSFVKNATNLLSYLKKNRQTAAYKEASYIISHHIKAIKKSGVKLKLSLELDLA